MGRLPDPDPAVSDDQLIARFRAGDQEAFTVCYRRHSPAVFRFALHMTGDRAMAAEVTQDVFVWFLNHPGRFDPARAALGAFLIGVTRRLLLKRRNEEFRWQPLSEAQLEAQAYEAPPGSPTAREVRQAIGALPVNYREAVVLCDLEGQSYEAAAAALGCPSGTIRSRLHRARQLLARKLGVHKEQKCWT